MALYLITNQHQADDCPELADELGSHYDVHKPSGDVNVYCNCGAGEHRMFFVVDASSATGRSMRFPPDLHALRRRSRKWIRSINSPLADRPS